LENAAQKLEPKDKYLKAVLAGSFGLGIIVALLVFFAWRLHVVPPDLYGMFSAVALLVCPPFVLSFAIGPGPDSDLALGLVVGTIVLSNAFLYAGVAAGIYAVMAVVLRRGRR
jgi:hypothetical protein